MPTSAERSIDALIDTSVAVALVVADHAAHSSTIEAIGDRRVGLAGHAAFETFSVLTRLPSPARRSPVTVAELLAENFSASCFLSAERAGDLFARLGQLGLGGGGAYDALVAASAVEHRKLLLSRDRRAIPTYRALGAEVELLSSG